MLAISAMSSIGLGVAWRRVTFMRFVLLVYLCNRFANYHAEEIVVHLSVHVSFDFSFVRFGFCGRTQTEGDAKSLVDGLHLNVTAGPDEITKTFLGDSLDAFTEGCGREFQSDSHMGWLFTFNLRSQEDYFHSTRVFVSDVVGNDDGRSVTTLFGTGVLDSTYPKDVASVDFNIAHRMNLLLITFLPQVLQEQFAVHTGQCVKPLGTEEAFTLS
jgi:hypothetical protein